MSLEIDAEMHSVMASSRIFIERGQNISITRYSGNALLEISAGLQKCIVGLPVNYTPPQSGAGNLDLEVEENGALQLADQIKREGGPSDFPGQNRLRLSVEHQMQFV